MLKKVAMVAATRGTRWRQRPFETLGQRLREHFGELSTAPQEPVARAREARRTRRLERDFSLTSAL